MRPNIVTRMRRAELYYVNCTVESQPYNYCIVAMGIYFPRARPRTREMAFLRNHSPLAFQFAVSTYYFIHQHNSQQVQPYHSTTCRNNDAVVAADTDQEIIANIQTVSFSVQLLDLGTLSFQDSTAVQTTCNVYNIH